MGKKIKKIIKMRNGSTIAITITNNSKNAGKGFNEIYLKEHDEWREVQDKEYQDQLEIESKNFGGL